MPDDHTLTFYLCVKANPPTKQYRCNWRNNNMSKRFCTREIQFWNSQHYYKLKLHFADRVKGSFNSSSTLEAQLQQLHTVKLTHSNPVFPLLARIFMQHSLLITRAQLIFSASSLDTVHGRSIPWQYWMDLLPAKYRFQCLLWPVPRTGHANQANPALKEVGHKG